MTTWPVSSMRIGRSSVTTSRSAGVPSDLWFHAGGKV